MSISTESSSNSLLHSGRKEGRIRFADEDEAAEIVISVEYGERVPLPLLPSAELGVEAEAEALMKRWLDPSHGVELGERFRRECPVTWSFLEDIRRGDGMNDWVTSRAALTEICNARLPILRAIESKGAVSADLRALRVLYNVVDKIAFHGLPLWGKGAV